MKIYNDRVVLLLVLNMLLVLIGYALAIFAGGSILQQMLWVKGSMLSIGIVNLVTIPYQNLRLGAAGYKNHALFSLLLLLTIFYAEDTVHSLSRTLLFIIPLAYIYFSINYLIARYSFASVEAFWLVSIVCIYSIPILSFVLLNKSVNYSNLYYISNEHYTFFSFVSNHYGWASCIVLSSAISLSQRVNSSNNLYKYILLIISLASIYLIIVSGNRTSWLVLLVILLLGVYKQISFSIFQKVLFIVLSIGLLTWLLTDPDSAIHLRLSKTYNQWEHGESRFMRLEQALEYLSYHWMVGIVGWGMFSPPNELSSNLHNSYAELFFGGGILLFVYFFKNFVFRPMKSIFHSSTFLWPLIPVLVIPFFESNLTVGQFLYYPWFGTIFLEAARNSSK